MSKNASTAREPLFHIVKRSGLPWWQSWCIRLLAVLAALIVCGIITVVLTGQNPLGVYATIIEGAVGTQRRLWVLLQNVAMLLCVALAITPAFKMRFWNIGAEGQVLVGGLATAVCMMNLGGKLPTALLIPVMILASVLSGALWGIIPAIFKARWNTNETLFTLMMNYIAIQLVSYFCLVKSVPKGSGTIGTINRDTEYGWFPKIGEYDYLLNVIVVLVLTAVMFVYLKYSKHGYEIAVVGESKNTARYIGVNVKKVIIRTMAVSGGLCGVAGLLLVASTTGHTLSSGTAGGRGFTAIMVSWLAKFNPLYMILTSLLIVFLQRGAIEISTIYGLNDSFSEIIMAIIIFFIIGCEFFLNYSIKLCKKEVGE